MLVPYESLSEEARVFIYPGSRKFYPNEIALVHEKMESFCASLDQIELSFKVGYDRFLIFFVSDKSLMDLDHQNQMVAFIQDLEKEFSIDLLDKVNVCFKQGDYVQRKEIPDFKKLIKNKGVSKKTIVFDHMVTSNYEYKNSWELPAEESWVSHFF